MGKHHLPNPPLGKSLQKNINSKQFKAINYQTSRHIPFFYEFLFTHHPPFPKTNNISPCSLFPYELGTRHRPPLDLVKCLDTGAAFVGFGSRSIQWWGSAADVARWLSTIHGWNRLLTLKNKGGCLRKTTMWTFLFMKILPYNSSYFSQKHHEHVQKYMFPQHVPNNFGVWRS